MTQLDRRAFLATTAAAAVAPSVGRAETGWASRSAVPWPTQEIYCAAHDGNITVAA